MSLIQIRTGGRTYYFGHLVNFTRVDSSTYTVQRNDTVYEIFGGKHAGAKRNEWYVSCKEWSKPIHTASIVDSLKMLDGM